MKKFNRWSINAMKVSMPKNIDKIICGNNGLGIHKNNLFIYLLFIYTDSLWIFYVSSELRSI